MQTEIHTTGLITIDAAAATTAAMSVGVLSASGVVTLHSVQEVW